MKYKVYLDTNQIITRHPTTHGFNDGIISLRRFLREKNIQDVDICIPQMVIEERIQQQLEKVEEALADAHNSINFLNLVGHSEQPISRRSDYRDILEREVDEFLTTNDVVRIPLPNVDNQKLIYRAIHKMSPFNDKGAGFKDTLIFLSIVEDAIKDDTASCRYIFCTNNEKDFPQNVIDEFKAETGKELYVLPRISRVQEKLDELIPLGLHLEARNTRIKNIVCSHLGEVMVAINKKGITQNDTYSPGFYRRDCFPTPSLLKGVAINPFLSNSSFLETDVEKKVIVGYDFESIEFTEFVECSEEKYKAYFTVETSIRYFENDNNMIVSTFSIPSPYSSRSRVNTQYFTAFAECDVTTESVDIVSVSSGMVGCC